MFPQSRYGKFPAHLSGLLSTFLLCVFTGSSSWQNADFRCSPSNVARPWSRRLGDFSAMERATPSTSPVWTCGGPVAEVHFLTPALLKSYFTFLFHIKTHRHVLLGWCQHCTLHGHMWLANCNFASRTLKNHVLWLNIACVFGIHPTKRFSKMFARPWWSVGNSTLRGLSSSSSLCSNCPNINYSGDVLKKDRARAARSLWDINDHAWCSAWNCCFDLVEWQTTLWCYANQCVNKGLLEVTILSCSVWDGQLFD
jgi:hypothetical protein